MNRKSTSMIEFTDIDGEMFDVPVGNVKHIEIITTPPEQFPSAKLFASFVFGDQVITSFLTESIALEQLGLAADRDVAGWLRLTNTDGNTVFVAADAIGPRKSEGTGSRIVMTHSGKFLDVADSMADVRAKIRSAEATAMPLPAPLKLVTPPKKRTLKGNR